MSSPQFTKSCSCIHAAVPFPLSHCSLNSGKELAARRWATIRSTPYTFLSPVGDLQLAQLSCLGFQLVTAAFSRTSRHSLHDLGPIISGLAMVIAWMASESPLGSGIWRFMHVLLEHWYTFRGAGAGGASLVTGCWGFGRLVGGGLSPLSPPGRGRFAPDLLGPAIFEG